MSIGATSFACIQGGSPRSRGWSIYGGEPLGEPATYAAMTAWHVNTVRVTLNEDCWLGINGVNPAYGGAAYRSAIRTMVALIHRAGMFAVLDLHWSAPGPYAAYWQQPMADSDHSIAFWGSVAATFRDDPAVAFDLYNEPFDYWAAGDVGEWACWLHGCAFTQFVSAGQRGPDGQRLPYTTAYRWRSAGMQQLVDAVRAAGARQPVIANGEDWGNDLSGWLSHEPVDPARQLVAGWHSYPGEDCDTTACWNVRVLPVARVAPVLIGETGDSVCHPATYVDELLPWSDIHHIGYLGWTWEPWSNCTNVLTRDWRGDPSSNYGSYFRGHLLGLVEAPAAARASTRSSSP